jgi:hypothetical protein
VDGQGKATCGAVGFGGLKAWQGEDWRGYFRDILSAHRLIQPQPETATGICGSVAVLQFPGYNPVHETLAVVSVCGDPCLVRPGRCPVRLRLKKFLRATLLWISERLKEPERQDHQSENRFLRDALNQLIDDKLNQMARADAAERISELIEARQMAGAGPWRVPAELVRETDRLIVAASAVLKQPGLKLNEALKMSEATPITAQGATGDIELALQNVEWRREINLSWLEFSRWGIQQIILISRLHYIKNPWIQRAINVSAQYIFGRGVEIMSEDDDANDVLKEFFDRNRSVLGQAALAELQKRLGYDGQVFFAFFADSQDKGLVTARTIDATEIFEIITNPEDTDEPWFYHRKWTQSEFDLQTGSFQRKSDQEAYYPALGFPGALPEQINSKPVMKDTPVLHFKGGTGVSKWHFDCPKAYAALDWAKAGRRWLEACASVRQALSQIAMTLTTKGGQQALEGAKQQLQTSVGPTSSLWDQNPPAVSGATFASGPGTTLAAFNTKGAGGDPADVKEYRNMVAAVFEIPPTFLGDLETANLATATTLDRPTELAMLEKQERWRELLVTIATYVLNVSRGAASGALREAFNRRKLDAKTVCITEARRITLRNGRRVYEAKKKGKTKDLEIKVIFPAIREGDMPAIVKAIAEAMTLDNKGGQIVGIDEKVGVGLLYEQLGVEDAGDIMDQQYPDGEYDPDRTKDPLPPPIGKVEPDPGGLPQAPGGSDPRPADKQVAAAERLVLAIQSYRKAS